MDLNDSVTINDNGCQFLVDSKGLEPLVTKVPSLDVNCIDPDKNDNESSSSSSIDEDTNEIRKNVTRSYILLPKNANKEEPFRNSSDLSIDSCSHEDFLERIWITDRIEAKTLLYINPKLERCFLSKHPHIQREQLITSYDASNYNDCSEMDFELAQMFERNPPEQSSRIILRKPRTERGSSVPHLDSFRSINDLECIGYAPYFLPNLTEDELSVLGWETSERHSSYAYPRWTSLKSSWKKRYNLLRRVTPMHCFNGLFNWFPVDKCTRSFCWIQPRHVRFPSNNRIRKPNYFVNEDRTLGSKKAPPVMIPVLCGHSPSIWFFGSKPPKDHAELLYQLGKLNETNDSKVDQGVHVKNLLSSVSTNNCTQKSQAMHEFCKFHQLAGDIIAKRRTALQNEQVSVENT